MKIVISPAKSLNFERLVPTTQYTEFAFANKAAVIDRVLKKKKPKDLIELMAISEKLAELNWQRNQERDVTAITTENGRQAVFAFDGEVYLGLDAYTLSATQIAKAQDSLRILSGLYGLLKPLDLIQPYRLEMGTAMPVGVSKNLYAFWKDTLTAFLNTELQNEPFLVNLASTEYFSALDTKKLNVPVLTPEFKEYKDGNLKMISFFAKKARGLMVRYILDNEVQTEDELKGFNYEGYAFDANLSSGHKLVFTR